ncbi:MFS transporter [Sphingomonas panacis]|uniref:MFS transporter n=1 Tax=Sphingomonas panacis TaxID=1560345 RepID=A0A1B3Z5B7_9SPHN|nr:DHA2 family efflux MFS transporter permease subunit [Sphingomonas panacis]AOH82617.1 MFS transporter [Sphingomonas panacis]
MDHPANSGGYRPIALVVAFALFMQQLDATVLTVALPAMSRDLGVPVTDLSLALTAYLVALAMFIPASGRLADRFGSRTVFCGAIVVFVLGSVACAQAIGANSLIAARFVQGLGGAMMMPVGRLVLLRSVRREDIAAALSWLVMPALVGPILGPLIGGFFVTYLDWRWIFYVNVPIGIVGIVFALFSIPQVRAEARSRFDLTGFALSGVALACLVFGFEMVSRGAHMAVIALLLGGGASLFAAYVFHAQRTTDPILDLSLLRIPTFGLSVAAGSLVRVTQGAQPFLLPLMFQLGFGLSAAATGAITMTGAIGALAMKPIAPSILRRFGYRDSLTIFGAAASLGYATCAFFRPGWPIPAMVAVLLLSGFSMSFLFTGYNAIAFVDVDKARMSAATSFYATLQQLSLSLGICLAAAALQSCTRLWDACDTELNRFTVAFLSVTVMSALSIIWNRRFAANAGR